MLPLVWVWLLMTMHNPYALSYDFNIDHPRYNQYPLLSIPEKMHMHNSPYALSSPPMVMHNHYPLYPSVNITNMHYNGIELLSSPCIYDNHYATILDTNKMHMHYTIYEPTIPDHNHRNPYALSVPYTIAHNHYNPYALYPLSYITYMGYGIPYMVAYDNHTACYGHAYAVGAGVPTICSSPSHLDMDCGGVWGANLRQQQPYKVSFSIIRRPTNTVHTNIPTTDSHYKVSNLHYHTNSLLRQCISVTNPNKINQYQYGISIRAGVVLSPLYPHRKVTNG